MIKNKITSELKKAFIEEIEKTINTGKEQGFLICVEDKGNDIKKGDLFPSKKRCQGQECGFIIKDVSGYCPDKIQGAFHTHPYLPNIENFYGHKPSEKEIKKGINIYKKHFERMGILLQSPSHHDVVDTLLNQCVGESEGTVCTGTDLDLNKVECWTVRNDEKIKIRDCSRANEEVKKRIGDKPREWVKPLFDKEIIFLK